jgi:hypothetical protein
MTWIPIHLSSLVLCVELDVRPCTFFVTQISQSHLDLVLASHPSNKKQKDDFGNNYFFYNPKTDVLKYSHIPRLNGDTQVLCHMGSLLSIAKFWARVMIQAFVFLMVKILVN